MNTRAASSAGVQHRRAEDASCWSLRKPKGDGVKTHFLMTDKTQDLESSGLEEKLVISS